jgi:hypothetical protein
MTNSLITQTAGINQQLDTLTINISDKDGRFQLKALGLEYWKATGQLIDVTDADGNWLMTSESWASNCHMGFTKFDNAQLRHGMLWQRRHHDIKINGRAAKLLIDYSSTYSLRDGDTLAPIEYRSVVWAD